MNGIPRILITGAGGFVCNHITPVMLSNGYDVIAHDRAFDAGLKSMWTTTWGDRVTFIDSDITSLPSCTVDAVIHGSALTASP